MLPEESVLEQCLVLIKVVQNRVCKPLIASGEDCNLEVFVGKLEALSGMWSYRKAGADVQSCVRVEYWNLHVWLEVFIVALIFIFVTDVLPLDMDQSLVKVEDQQLFEAWLLELELDFLLFS